MYFMQLIGAFFTQVANCFSVWEGKLTGVVFRQICLFPRKNIQLLCLNWSSLPHWRSNFTSALACQGSKRQGTFLRKAIWRNMAKDRASWNFKIIPDCFCSLNIPYVMTPLLNLIYLGSYFFFVPWLHWVPFWLCNFRLKLQVREPGPWSGGN